MTRFTDYAAAFQESCDPGILDYCLKGAEFSIYEGPDPLLTPAGNFYSHPSEAFVRMMLTDLQFSWKAGLPPLSSPVLFSFRKDVIEAGNDPFTDEWTDWLDTDPFIRIKTNAHPSLSPLSPDDPMLSFSFNTLAGLSMAVSNLAGRIMGEIDLEEVDTHPFISLLKSSYERLSDDLKAGIRGLSAVHRSGLVLPLMLVLDEINTPEYAKGVVALKMMPAAGFLQIQADAAMVSGYLDLVSAKAGREKLLEILIHDGESSMVEFKSTLRWDLRQNKPNPAIERACLKTISAFLNSSGGSLLIGVRDDGSIEGIESDKFANEDKFLLHLWTLVRTWLGMDITPYVRTRLARKDDKTVCIADCLPAGRPVFLRQPGFDEEMYIRVGPSSNALDISEALEYVREHFGAGS
jgi:hypothetical protein